MARQLLFLIRSLDVGGTERQLVELVKGLDRTRFRVAVAPLYEGGGFVQELATRADVAFHPLGKQGRWDVDFLRRLRGVIRDTRPQVVIGYLNTVNELALLAGRLAGAPVVWNIRSSFVDFKEYDWLPRLAFKTGAWLSRFPELTIFNSWAGLRYHQAHGYDARHTRVIPNGIDAERYHVDRAAGARVRQEWGLSPDTRTIGIVGRLDPIKGHRLFLQAAARLRSGDDGALWFVCVGDGDARLRAELQALAHELGVTDRVVWAGGRADMPAVYNALDLCVSASHGEGFSNAIGEAMASGVPCVVTDVGDSATITGDVGVVVRPNDSEALAEGLRVALTTFGADRAARVRERIVSQFSVRRMIEATQTALEEVS